MGDNPEISDDEDDYTLIGHLYDDDDYDENPQISGVTSQDIEEIHRYNMQMSLRGLVNAFVRALESRDPTVIAHSQSLQRQRAFIAYACNAFVVADMDGQQEEKVALATTILRALVSFFVEFINNADVAGNEMIEDVMRLWADIYEAMLSDTDIVWEDMFM